MRKIRSETRARYFIRNQAFKKGWNLAHADSGGDFLEENEIRRLFPDIGIVREEPDFMLLQHGYPVMIVEAKNEFKKAELAIKEACEYVESINSHGKYHIKIAVGVAGEEDAGFVVIIHYLTTQGWRPLTSHGIELTSFPSYREIECALAANDSTTLVNVPEPSDFVDAAVELSAILRLAKIEAPLRPKVIGSMVAAMYEGKITLETDPLGSVNRLMEQTITKAQDIAVSKKAYLIDALRLSGADFNRLAPFIGRIVAILQKLNIRAVLQTDTDFLGMFYEAFLRYGYDNNALGIVFTPRHITRLCVDLIDVKPNDRVIDIAAGTGGFLVAAFDKMIASAKSPQQKEKIKSSIYGFDTNPTIWALATLNMFFRGDGKSHIEHGSCFDEHNRNTTNGIFNKAFLNPPFSQKNEPEFLFINAAMETLEPEGILAAVVYAGVFCDDEHALWRKEFLRKHTLLAIISLPEELFYPTAAPTSILITKAHIPHEQKAAFIGRIWNDGYEKLKGRRISKKGSQLLELQECFSSFLIGKTFDSALCNTVAGEKISSGGEWSPQHWLPQPAMVKAEFETIQHSVVLSILQTVAHFPEIAEQALSDFVETLSSGLPDIPYGTTKPLSAFFTITNGKSSGEKNHSEGDTAYVSSGDTTNSVISLVTGPLEEKFTAGGITVTAFGRASVQPWPFFARGNGGSSVRVLIPRFAMTFRELIWFAGQINMQKWRFFYARMAIKSRITHEEFRVEAPPARLEDIGLPIHLRVKMFRRQLEDSSILS